MTQVSTRNVSQYSQIWPQLQVPHRQDGASSSVAILCAFIGSKLVSFAKLQSQFSNMAILPNPLTKERRLLDTTAILCDFHKLLPELWGQRLMLIR